MMEPDRRAPAQKRRQSRFTREPLAQIRSSPGRYLAKPWLPTTGVGVIAGPSTSAKTFLALEMALRISRGEPFNGHRVKQAGVLYISAEDPEGVRLRIDAWCSRYGRGGAFQLIPQAPDLRDSERMAELLEAIADAAYEFDADNTPLGLIVLDTMSKASPGADQNSSADMGAVMAMLARVSAETSAMVMVIAHTPKDETRGIAGWYGQFAGADVVIMTTRDPDDPDLRTATLSKVKNGQDGQKLAFRLEVVEVGVDEDLDPITSCVVAFEAPSVARPRPDRTIKLNQWATIAHNALTYITEHSDTVAAPALDGVPRGARAVKTSEVRAWAMNTGMAGADEKPSTVRMRWSRALADLIAARKAGQHGEQIWLI